MKTVKQIFNDYISDENIFKAIKNASKGKLKRRHVKEIHDNPEIYLDRLRDYGSNFYNKKHKPKLIYDGITRKQREIIIPKFQEQIIHHMVVNILKPIFMNSMYKHSYGSIPGRGVHSGKKTVEKWIRTGGRDVKYCFKMDIHHFFQSIPHDILTAKLSKLIKDEKFLNILKEIINAVPDGIPLGFYTSQWFANFYLTKFDHWVKQELHVKYYIRYMDDIVIFASDKRKLHHIREEITSYLDKELGLKVKDNWQVFRFHYYDRRSGKYRGRMLDFMGFKFYRNKTTLRRKIFLRAKRKAKRMFKKDKVTIFECKQLLSYLGWFSHTNTYAAFQVYIKPYVSVRKIRQRISNYDKRIKKGA